MKTKNTKFIGSGILLAALASCLSTVSAAEYNLKSPNNDLQISFNYENNTLSYSIDVDKQQIIDNAVISLTVDGKKLPCSNK